MNLNRAKPTGVLVGSLGWGQHDDYQGKSAVLAHRKAIDELVVMNDDVGKATRYLNPIRWLHVTGLTADDVKSHDFKSLLRDAGSYGFEVSSIGAGSPGDYSTKAKAAASVGLFGPQREAKRDLQYRMIEAAAEHDIVYVQSHIGQIGGQDPAIDAAIKGTMLEIARYADDYNVRFLIESGDESPLTLAAFVYRLNERIGTQVVGINMDPANMVLYGVLGSYDCDPIKAMDAVHFEREQRKVSDEVMGFHQKFAYDRALPAEQWLRNEGLAYGAVINGMERAEAEAAFGKEVVDLHYALGHNELKGWDFPAWAVLTGQHTTDGKPTREAIECEIGVLPGVDVPNLQDVKYQMIQATVHYIIRARLDAAK